MASASQSTRVQQISDLSGLARTVFADGVKWHVRAESAFASLFNKATAPADYQVRGDKLQGAAKLRYGNRAMASSSKLPDHGFQDAVNWEITPWRRYRRIALDPFHAERASGAGAFQDLEDAIFEELWDDWGRMEIRHAIGDTRGFVALVASRSNQTTIVVKDGYGHTGTNPFIHIEPGTTTLAWLNVSASYAVGGAGTVSTVTYSSKTIVFAGNFDDNSTTVSANDPLVLATTASTASSHFETEYNNAPHGFMSIVDPNGVASTKFGISETTYQRWKPLRETSVTFDQQEVSAHFGKLRASSTSPVNAQTHVCVAQEGPIQALGATLLPYQQMGQLGRKLEGGHDGVRITGIGTGPMDFLVDDYFPHDILATVCVEDLKRADLAGEADFYEADGSMWSRLPDEDRQEAFVREYGATWSDRRNRHASLKGITVASGAADDFAPIPR